MRRIALILLSVLLLTSMIPSGWGQPLAAAGVSIMTNSGFEEDISGWIAGGNSIISRDTAERYSGVASAKVERPTNYAGNIGQWNKVFEAGRSYYFSVWVKRAEGTGNLGIYVHQPGVQWDGGTGYPSMVRGDVGTSWTQLTAIRKFPTEETSNGTSYLYNNARVYVQHALANEPRNEDGTYTDFYVDDFVVELVEPETLQVAGEASLTIPLPGNPAKPYEYAATVANQFGNSDGVEGLGIIWSLDGSPAGLQIDSATGILTVSSAAAAGDVTIRAVSAVNDSAVDTFTVNLVAEEPEDEPKAPIADQVTVSGQVKPGRSLQASYQYLDSNGDEEAGSLYRWYIGNTEDGTFTEIAGESALIYTVKPSDVGRYIQFGVTPQTAVAPTIGEEAFSDALLVANNHAPVANNVSINGMTKTGEVLTASYSYGDADGDPETVSTYRWLQSETRNGAYSPIPGAEGMTLSLTSDQLNHFIVFEVTPVDSLSQGAAYLSQPVGMVLSVIPPVQSSSNLISNSGFEEDLSGWVRDANATISRDTTEMNTGFASVKVTRSANYAGNVGQQNISFEPGKSYYFSAWVKRASGTGDVGIYVNQNGIRWEGGTAYPRMAFANVGTSWVQLQSVMTFPTEDMSKGYPYVYDYARVYIQHVNGNDPLNGDGVYEAYYVDDVVVEPVEPRRLAIAGATTMTVPLPGNSAKKYAYTASLTNQINTSVGLAGSPVTWLLEGEPAGVSMDAETGYVTVSHSASAGTIRIKAVSIVNPEANASLTVTLTAAAPDVQPKAPIASHVTVSAQAKPGRMLTADYDYEDPNGDAEADSSYNWYIGNTSGGTFTPIPGAVHLTYIVQSEDVGKYIKFGVTPHSAVAPENGVLVYGEPVLASDNSAPIIENITIAGVPKIGETLTGDYYFVDADGDVESGSTYRWLQSDAKTGPFIPIPGAEAGSLVLVEQMQGKFIQFEVTPRDAFSQGIAYVSLPTEAVVEEIAGAYYVDPVNGNDNNDGSEDSPFLTITRARDKVRAVSDTMSSDITVYLRSGIYYPDYIIKEEKLFNPDFTVSETLQVKSSLLAFDERDSGKNGYHVVYRNYPGETPVISGGRTIAGWTLHDAENNIYRADSGGDLNTRQLYVNGQRATRARSEEGFANVLKTATGFTTTDTHLADWGNPQHIEIVFKQSWTSPRAKVASIAANGGVVQIKMQEPGWFYATNKGATSATLPWYYENAYELIDEEGEWYLDLSTETFYYKPRTGEDMATAEVVAPELEELMSVKGSDLDALVQNMKFEGIHFAYSTWLRPSSNNGMADGQNNYIREAGVSLDVLPNGAVNVENGHFIEFRGNDFSKIGSIALRTTDGVQDTLIVGNRFTDISGNAIAVGEASDDQGHTKDARKLNRNNDILNNYIYNVGREFFSSSAISAGYAIDMDIRHNEIGNIPYSGLHVGYGWSKVPSSNTRNVRIESNLIYDAMQVLNDGANIYTIGTTGGSPEQPSIVSGNYLLRNHDTSQGSIYFDEGSNYWQASHNVVETAVNYLHIWTNTIRNIDVDFTYTTTPYFRNNGVDTTVTNTQVYPDAKWPSEALAIIKQAGLENEYKHLRPAEDVERLFIRDISLSSGGTAAIEIQAALTDNGAAIEVDSGEISYASDHPEVAVVDAHGVVTAVGPGRATVKATLNGRVIEVENAIVVDDEFHQLTVSASRTEILTRFSVMLDVAGLSKYGVRVPVSSLTFESLNPEVATVDAEGRVTGAALGEAEIRVTGVSQGVKRSGNIVITVIESDGESYITDADNWYVSGSGSAEAAEDQIVLSTPAGFAVFQGKRFGDELLKLHMTINDTSGWHGLFFRSQENDGGYSSSTNAMYIVVFKQDIVELHRFNEGARTVLYGDLNGFTSVFGGGIPNQFMSYNEEHLIEFGALNVDDGLRIVLIVDGHVVIDRVDTQSRRIAESGYLGVYATSGNITLRAPSEPSVNLNLTELYVNGQLVPDFSPEDTGPYQVKVAHSEKVVDISYTASNPGVTVKIAGNEQLAVGDNTIAITVRGPNEESRTYTVVVTREAAAPDDGGGIIIDNEFIIETINGILNLPAGRAGHTSLSDGIVVEVSRGATTKPVRVTVERGTDPSAAELQVRRPVSPVFVLSSDEPRAFEKPIDVTIMFDPAGVKDGQQPAVFYYDETTKEWKKLGGEVDGDRIMVQIDQIDQTIKLVVMVDEESRGASEQKFFSDMAEHWAESLIGKAAQMGMVNGYPNGEFRPDAAISRAEFIVMLMNALKIGNEASGGAGLAFTDGIDPWARGAITQAVQNGIVNGYDDGSFRPRASITRSELAVMMARAAGVIEEASAATGFSDEKDIPSWAKGAVAYLKGTGIVEGRGGNRFDPGATATRAEAVAVIMRLLEAIQVE